MTAWHKRTTRRSRSQSSPISTTSWRSPNNFEQVATFISGINDDYAPTAIIADPTIPGVYSSRENDQIFTRRDAQSATESPLLMSARTSPSIMNVGETWMPFWRAYLQCHLTSRSRSGIAKASDSFTPL